LCLQKAESKAQTGHRSAAKTQIYSGVACTSPTRKELLSPPVVPEQATGWRR